MSRIVSVKCPNCGANLDLDDNKRKAKCQYCNTNILLEKDLNDVITANIFEARKFAKGFIPLFFIIFTFIFITSFTFIAFTSFRLFSRSSNSFSIKSFNNNFTYSSGTKSGIFVTQTLDDVISSNKKHSDHQIRVKYNEYNTKDEDEIISIKSEIGTYTYYEVSIDYDRDGYVNSITIKDKK